MRLSVTLTAGILAVVTGNTHALTLTQGDLPTALGGCASATCIAELTSTVDTGFMSAFMMARLRTDNSGYDFKWLIRYGLTAPSARTYVVDPDYGTGSTTAYSGYLWLEAPQTLDLSGQNLFRVYTDHVSPDPDAEYVGDGLSTWVFGMDAQAAIGGGAAYYNSGSDGSYDPVEYGDLAMPDGPLACIECGVDIRLNLVGLDYAANGTSTFDPADDRGLVLRHREFYDYFTTTRAFHVQPVPLPPAVWLFGWGLAAVVAVRRRTSP